MMAGQMMRRLDCSRRQLLLATGSLVLSFGLRVALALAPPQAPPQLSPQAAYEQAARPVDIVHGSIGNWSDSEQAALAVAIEQAREGCAARSANQFTGDDLLAFARLCTLGQQWFTGREAATLYINAQPQAAAPPAVMPGLTQAYAFKINASLRLDDSLMALTSSREMLSAVAYTELTSEATTATIRYLQVIHSNDALSLLIQRQPILLSLIRAQSTPNPSTATAQQPLALHALYADAMELPAQLQFDGQSETAAASVVELEAALPANLAPDDSILIAESRRQYDLIGKPFWPAIASFGTIPPNLKDASGSATVLLLFPDWCAQCVRMGLQFADAVLRLGADGARFIALLAQAAPPPVPPPPAAKPVTPSRPKPAHPVPQQAIEPVTPQPKTAAELLSGTPTTVVSSETLKNFAATNFPFLIVADHRGIIRFLQPVPENALVRGGLVDQVVARVLVQWPPNERQAARPVR